MSIVLASIVVIALVALLVNGALCIIRNTFGKCGYTALAAALIIAAFIAPVYMAHLLAGVLLVSIILLAITE